MDRACTAARACYIRPRLLRPLDEFAVVLDRCAELGFDTVVLPCPFVQGEAWSQARLHDPERLAPAFGWRGEALDGLSRLGDLGGGRGLRIVLDLRMDQLAGVAPVVAAQPHWFRPQRTSDGPPPDPRRPADNADAAVARFDGGPIADELTGWWIGHLQRWHGAGIAGYRCLWPQRIPAAAWRAIIAAMTATGKTRPEFWAWTPGVTPDELLALAPCGFDAAFSSLPWWDFRARWYLEEDSRLRGFPAVIAPIDDPAGDDPGGEMGFEPPESSRDREAWTLTRARNLEFAVASADGLLVALEPEPGPVLDDAIRNANAALAARHATLRRKGLRPLSMGGSGPALALFAESLAGDDGTADGNAAHSRLVLVNPDHHHVVTMDAAGLLRHAGDFTCFSPLRPAHGDPIDAGRDGATIALEPAEVRTWSASRMPMVRMPKSRRSVEQAAAAPRIAIEGVCPAVDGGRFPVKRTVGERVTVHADILCDGHELLAAAVLWRPVGSRGWKSAPMRQLGNDRWCGTFTLGQVGRHEFTVEAWRDAFATARADLEKKRAADKLSTLDVEEICRMVVDAAASSSDPELDTLSSQLRDTADDAVRVALLVAPETSQAMTRADHKPFLLRHPTNFTIDAERLAAGYGSWYELFPRSQSAAVDSEPQRHGTFADVIDRLPAIRDMGFDVLYMPPIHPIGRTNRKGRNNSVTAQPGEPGSPYAIGAREGGHDAIHPELGTLEDFRRLVSAATSHGLELALDFAIQCSPDHPWLREHLDWFAWRADGSIRYAENPPKKYEDIVNVDFYAGGAIPGLWLALRDVVAFWVNEGVRLFRVDNPHTKPFPFWEWMIGDIRGRHPDVVFLSEAFTRPKLMYRLAKIGFSQSYTYFTWRNDKRELTAYLTELAHGEVRDYFRPHFFVNTPDINPVFLQTSGRAGHLIRAALATTLSGLWGMYSGFELCEATPLVPGKEEYLDSEKYQLRAWDWQRPGNIVSEITRLNLLRRLNPALQTHLGITFYNAFNDNILYFGKRGGEHGDMVLVAINLDPHSAQEADFELPLWEWGLPDDGELQVEDLWRGTRGIWRGKMQRMRLDPVELPFAIWRICPPKGVPG